MYIKCNRYMVTPNENYQRELQASFDQEPTSKPNVLLEPTPYGFDTTEVKDFYEYKVKSEDRWLDVTLLIFYDGDIRYIDIPVDVLCAQLNEICNVKPKE